MKTYITPHKDEWASICFRPSSSDEALEENVLQILERVKQEGDKALLNYALQFDRVKLKELKTPVFEIDEAETKVPAELKEAITIATKNIRLFHSIQNIEEPVIETMPGVECWRKSVAIEKVGLYIPGGTAPLFSTLLMLAIPAQLAGCKSIIVCTPPDENGKINPAILYTAKSLGITEIYKTGGAQAIAAMGYGTETIPSVDKIFGPGNKYVTKAKELIQKAGIAIDLPAGPSELLVIADKNADADFVVSDLLSQAEHGTDSQVVLLTDSIEFIDKVNKSLAQQVEVLPRKQIIITALKNSFIVLFETIEQCVAFSNFYAPEHLIIATELPESYTGQIQNAGSVFLGSYSCESTGDYASGTNHTLPTNGYAKNYSAVSLDSFIKKISFQKVSIDGLKRIGKTIEIMAEAEQLMAHKNAVSIRLKKVYEEQ